MFTLYTLVTVGIAGSMAMYIAAWPTSHNIHARSVRDVFRMRLWSIATMVISLVSEILTIWLIWQRPTWVDQMNLIIMGAIHCAFFLTGYLMDTRYKTTLDGLKKLQELPQEL